MKGQLIYHAIKTGVDMRIIFIVLAMFIFIACNDKKPQKEVDLPKIIENTSEVRNDIISTEALDNDTFGYVYKESKMSYGGIVYNSDITDDTANVYMLPSLESKINDTLLIDTEIKIIGVSKNRETINDHEGYWVEILYGEDKYGDPKIGWIFSNSLNIERCFSSELKIVESEQNDQGNLTLYGEYSINDKDIEFSVSCSKSVNQDFYIFSWDYSEHEFHYSNNPGIYIWYENTKTLEHITYLGGEGSVWGGVAWVAVTDDLKYLIQDYGTAPPPRGVIAWRLEDGEVVFSGIYYDDINLSGHSIETVKYYNEYYAGKWLNRNTQLSEEEILFAQNYLESNKTPEEHQRMFAEFTKANYSNLDLHQSFDNKEVMSFIMPILKDFIRALAGASIISLTDFSSHEKLLSSKTLTSSEIMKNIIEPTYKL
jgi:hypothetical protein